MVSQIEFLANTFTFDTTLNNRSGDLLIHADGDIVFNENAAINSAGVTLDFVNSLEHISAGNISIESDSGSFIATNSSTSIDISGDQLGGEAGSVSIKLENGELNYLGSIFADANSSYDQGEIDVVSNTLADFSSFNQILNNGFVNQKREIRVKSGDLNINQGDIVTANQVEACFRWWCNKCE